MVSFLKKNAAAVAFLVLAFFGGVAINQSAKSTISRDAQVLYQREITGCHEDNQIRYEINKRIEVSAEQRDIVLRFARDARDARKISYQNSHKQSDLIASRRYGNLVKEMQNEVHFGKLALLNCNREVKKP